MRLTPEEEAELRKAYEQRVEREMKSVVAQIVSEIQQPFERPWNSDEKIVKPKTK